MTLSASIESADQSGLRCWFDADAQLVRVVGCGFWTTADAEAHFAELHQLVDLTRAKLGRVRVLADMRDAAVQSIDVGEKLRGEASQIYEASDRIAVVMSSQLLRMQIRRLTSDHDHHLFDTIDAAEAWLGSAE